MSDTLKSIALKRNWTYQPGFLFWPPKLIIASHQTTTTVTFINKNNLQTTVLHSALNLKKEGHAYVGPQQYGKIIIVTDTIQDIKIGNDVFDRSFIVQCERLDIQTILGANIQDEMMVLFPVLPSLRINQKEMTLTAKEIISNEGTLMRFINLGLKILGQVSGS